jgi:hypothetical protein
VRRVARIDANQTEIVNALRQIGCSVGITSSVGDGFPDLVCGFRNRNLCMELKDGSKPPSARELTEEQRIWHAGWKGQVAVVESIQQAIEVVTKDESLYRSQRAAAIQRETKKVALVASPTGDSYTVTINDGKSTVDMVFPCSDPFEAIQKIVQYAETL